MEHRKSPWIVTLLLFILLLSLAACGGQGESETQTTPVEAATEDQPAKEEAKTDQPAAAEAATATPQPEAAIEPAEPATVLAASQVIDLPKLPRLEEATAPSVEQIGYLSYGAAVEIEAAIDFYRQQLADLGWQEAPEQEVHSDNVNQKVAVFAFQKAGFWLEFQVMQAAGDETLYITLSNRGNVDARSLPRYPEAEVISEPGPANLLYVTPAKMEPVADFVRQELATLGWQAYSDAMMPEAAGGETPLLHFIQNGIDLSVTLFTADTPEQAGKTNVSYDLRLAATDLPVMADAQDIQLNNSGYAYSNDFYVTYTSPSDAETNLAFYQQALADLGWQAQGTPPTEGGRILLGFERAGETQDLLLDLNQNEKKQTQVTLGMMDLETEMPVETPALEEADEIPLVEGDVEIPSLEGEAEGTPALSARALPLPADAQAPLYDAETEQITYTSPADIESLVEFYRLALLAQGWQEDEIFSTVEENIAILSFEQGDASLSLTLFNLGLGEETEVTIDATGLAWDETASPLEGDSDTPPTEDEVEADLASWPIPAEAEKVKQQGDELSFVIAWDLGQVADFYRPTYEQYNLDSSCFDDMANYTSVSCSTGNGEQTVSLNLFENLDGQTEVTVYLDGFSTGLANISADPESLTLIDEDGMPVPSDFTLQGSEGSQFRKSLNGASAADLASLVALYQAELPDQGWLERPAAAEGTGGDTSLIFEQPGQHLTINLSQAAEGTDLHLVWKSPDAAKAMGILPPAGQVRLYFGNMNEAEVSITINRQTIKVAPTSPDSGPEDMAYLDLAPGQYTYTLAIPGEAEISDSIETGADESWALLIGPGGAFPIQSY